MNNRTLMLVGLVGLWGAVAVIQVGSLPESQEVPLTYRSGQPATRGVKPTGTDDGLTLHPIRVTVGALPSAPKRNMFAPVERPAPEPRIAKKPIRKQEDLPPVAAPVAPPAPPMPSPEELAEQAARRQQELKRRQLQELMAQYRYLGYLTREGAQKAFLGKGQEIYILREGETVDGQFVIAAIDATRVKLLERTLNLETILLLKKEGGASDAS